MPTSFDAYHQWLGIPPDEQPPDHYRLLGVDRFEANREALRAAADRQTVHLNTFRHGPQAVLAKRLLAEVEAARVCLLDPDMKAAYDRSLGGPPAAPAARPLKPPALPHGKPAQPPPDDPWAAMTDVSDPNVSRVLPPLRRRRWGVWPWVKLAGLLLVVTVAVTLILAAGRFGLRKLESLTTPPVEPSQTEPIEPAYVPSAFSDKPSQRAVPPPESLVPPLVRVLAGHPRPVTAVAFAPDDKSLVSVGKDGLVCLWNTQTGEVLWSRGDQRRELAAVVFSPDGSWLASTGDDRMICIREVATGELRRTLAGHAAPLRAVAVSPDGSTLASTGLDGTVRLWDPAAGRLKREWPAHEGGVMALAYSADGKLLATGGLDQGVKLWDAASGALRRTLAGQGAAVRAVAFSPDGAAMASGDAGGTIILWDVADGSQRAALVGHTDRVTALVFAPDGKTLLSAGGRRDQTIRAWNLAAKPQGAGEGESKAAEAARVIEGHGEGVAALALSQDGRLLASGDSAGEIHLWDARAVCRW